MLNKASLLLLQLKQTPKMFATCKEALIMRVSTILEMSLEDFNASDFYEKHLDSIGNTYINIHDEVSEKWSDAVIDDAIIILKQNNNPS